MVRSHPLQSQEQPKAYYCRKGGLTTLQRTQRALKNTGNSFCHAGDFLPHGSNSLHTGDHSVRHQDNSLPIGGNSFRRGTHSLDDGTHSPRRGSNSLDDGDHSLRHGSNSFDAENHPLPSRKNPFSDRKYGFFKNLDLPATPYPAGLGPKPSPKRQPKPKPNTTHHGTNTTHLGRQRRTRATLALGHRPEVEWICPATHTH